MYPIRFIDSNENDNYNVKHLKKKRNNVSSKNNSINKLENDNDNQLNALHTNQSLDGMENKLADSNDNQLNGLQTVLGGLNGMENELEHDNDNQSNEWKQRLQRIKRKNQEKKEKERKRKPTTKSSELDKMLDRIQRRKWVVTTNQNDMKII